MDNGDFQAPVGGPYPCRTYEPLKEEMEILPRPQPLAVTSTVVNVGPYQAPPRDHILWSLFNFMYMNFCCLGFMAVVFSVKARDRKLAGDLNGAISYGSTAKCLNITALVLTLLSFILFIILLATGVIVFADLLSKQKFENQYVHYGSG